MDYKPNETQTQYISNKPARDYRDGLDYTSGVKTTDSTEQPKYVLDVDSGEYFDSNRFKSYEDMQAYANEMRSLFDTGNEEDERVRVRQAEQAEHARSLFEQNRLNPSDYNVNGVKR